MTLTATSRQIDGGLSQEVDVNGRHTIVTDEPVDIGGTDVAPAPHELLPATLASCIGTMIALYAQKRAWEIGDVTVDVSYDTDAVPRRFDVRLRLPDGLSPVQVERLRRVAANCPVRRALEAGFGFDETLDIGSTPVGAAALTSQA